MQLSLTNLFDNQAKDEILSKKALDLLNALNDGEKKQYEPFAYVQLNQLILLVAKRGDDHLFNVIDLDGNCPSEMTCCWRVGEIVRKELDEFISTNQAPNEN